MLQPFSSEIFWFEKLSFSWNRVSWLCQSACGECFLCWVISGLPGDENIKAQPFKRSWSFEDIRGRYIVGQIWSWWFPDFLLKKIGGTSFCLILGTRPPACLPHQNHLFSFYLHPTSLLPSSRHICTRYIARPAQSLPPSLRIYNTPTRTPWKTLKHLPWLWKHLKESEPIPSHHVYTSSEYTEAFKRSKAFNGDLWHY